MPAPLFVCRIDADPPQRFDVRLQSRQMDTIPPDITLEWNLRDGTPIRIRPVVPDDKPFFTEAFEQLSAQSRYLRFMRPVPALHNSDLRFLTEIDYMEHMAWGALSRTPTGDKGIGVARYVRHPGNPRCAEAAVTIIDEFQHRGVGTLLIGALYWSALRSGIESFEGYILTENEHMMRLLQVMNARLTFERYGAVHARVSVVKDPMTLPDTHIGRILKQVVKALSDHSSEAFLL